MTCRSRRRALRRMAAIGAIPLVAPSLFSRLVAGPEEDDEGIAGRILRVAKERSLRSAAMGEIVTFVARQFLGTRYAAGTLEEEGEERLVVNLREFDCVTLVESTLALSRCIAMGVDTREGFRRELTRIRYRGGVIDGYASRLHYFSDWIHDNERKGIVNDETSGLGGAPAEKTIDFMTSRPGNYPRLLNTAVRAAIMAQERTISTRQRFSISRDRLPAVEEKILDGDILGITTSISGLDITHTGFALKVDGRLHSLHAPMTGGVVSIGDRPLADVLHARPTQTGVVVARPVRPDASPEKN